MSGIIEDDDEEMEEYKTDYDEDAVDYSGDEDLPVVEMTAPDGKIYRATIVAMFKLDGGAQEYAAIIAHMPAEDGTYPIQLFRAEVAGDTPETMQVTFNDIRDDEEYNSVRKKYIEILNQDAAVNP